MATIVMLLHEYYPSDVRVRKEAVTLKEAGHNVFVICLCNMQEALFEIVDGVNVFRLNLQKQRGSKLRYIYEYMVFFYKTYTKLKKLLKQYSIQIVQVHTLPDFLVFAAHPAKQKGAKVILDMHEIMPEFYMSKFFLSENHFIIRILRYVERKSLEYADYVITVNHALKRKFESRAVLKHDITVIMNTVDERIFPILPKQLKKKFTLLYHGSLITLYNLGFAIKALAKMGSLLDYEFYIYGEGPDKQELNELIKNLKLTDKIFLSGHIHYAKVPQVLAHAHVGILPIKRDVMIDLSFSNKLAEYVHSGIPVLTSDIPSVIEYFPADTIFYFKDNETEDFQSKLLTIYHNYQEALNYSEKAYKLYTRISWSIMRQRLLELVNRIAK